MYRYNTFPNATFYYHAVVWSGGVIQDINTGKDQQGNQLLAPGTTWTLEQATAINDSGQIAGYGLNPSGNTDAFLLTPAMPGDANVDGRVDINDLTIVLSNFGSANMNWFSGDFNGDGKVDVKRPDHRVEPLRPEPWHVRRHRRCRHPRTRHIGSVVRRSGRSVGLRLAETASGIGKPIQSKPEASHPLGVAFSSRVLLLFSRSSFSSSSVIVVLSVPTPSPCSRPSASWRVRPW